MNTQDRFDDLVAERLRADASRPAPAGLLDATLSRISATPQRRRGGWWGGTVPRLLAAAAVIALAVVVGTQLPGLLNRPVGTDASPSATPSPSVSPSTAPSAEPSGSVAPTPSATPGSAVGPDDTLLALYRSCHVTPPIIAPHTSISGDGRVIWLRQGSPDELPLLSVRRLNEAGLARVQAEIVDSGLFVADADHPLEPRPDAGEPPGHGLCVYEFDWNGGPDPVHVTSVGWLGDDEEATYYQPSPERKALDDVALRLIEPEAWFAPDEWADTEAVPFEPDSYLLVAHVFEAAPDFASEGAPDVDAISWPFPDAPDAFGELFANDRRCATADASAIETFAAELAAAGLEQFERPADGPMITLPWASRSSVVEVQLQARRPDGEPTCDRGLPE